MRVLIPGLALAAALAAGMAACARPSAPAAVAPPPPYAAAAAQAPSARRGHDLVQRDCAGCHAIEATGASSFAPAPPFRTLHETYPPEALEESLAEGILSGHPAMPQFTYSAGEIADIVAWLKSLETPPGS